MKLAILGLFALSLFGQFVPSPVPPPYISGGGGGGGGPIAFVNSAVVDPGGSGFTTLAAPAVSLTSGNTAIICVSWVLTGNAITSITDTAGNTYTAATNTFAANGGTNWATQIWYSIGAVGNASNVVTVNWASGVIAPSIHVLQYAHIHAFEVGTFGTGVTSGESDSPSFTTAATGNLNIVVASQNNSGTNTWTAGTGYTLRTNSGTAADSQTEEMLLAASGSQIATISSSPNASGMTISVASFN